MRSRLFVDFPLPWRVDREYVLAADDTTVYCNTQYYPYSELSMDQWEELCNLVNEKGEIE